LSFSEINQIKKIVILETNPTQVTAINEIEIPTFRNIIRVKGNLETCEKALQKVESNEFYLTPWVEVVLDNPSNAVLGAGEINKIAESLDLEVLKVTLNNERTIVGLEELTAQTKHIKELSPLRVFEMKCKEMDFDLKSNERVLDAFNEALQIALDN